MNLPKLPNLAVFLLFFGIALIEALQKKNWLEAALFLALAFFPSGRILGKSNFVNSS